MDEGCSRVTARLQEGRKRPKGPSAETGLQQHQGDISHHQYSYKYSYQYLGIVQYSYDANSEKPNELKKGASWDAACCEQGVFFGGLARSRSTRTARYKHFYGTSAVWAETTDDKREAGI